MDKICCITPTGDRKLALDRCLFYLNRQTKKTDYWIISDSGKEPYKPETNLDLIYAIKPFSSNKAKDFTGNILTILNLIPSDAEYIIVFEDDDYYFPTYIETTLKRLENNDLVGQPYALYYNVKYRCYRVNENSDRASFCETAFRRNLIPLLKFCCEVNRESAFVDSRLWYSKRFSGRKQLFADQRLVIGMKGLPGRSGIGLGHRPTSSYIKDFNFLFLKKLIGDEDCKWYQNLKL